MGESPTQFNVEQAASTPQDAAKAAAGVVISAAQAASDIATSGTSSESTKSAFQTLAQGLTGLETALFGLIPGIGGAVGGTVAGILGPTFNSIIVQDLLQAVGGLLKHIGHPLPAGAHPVTLAVMGGANLSDAVEKFQKDQASGAAASSGG